MPDHTEEYLRVLASPRWRALKRKRLSPSGQFGHCEKCERFELAKNLELHHKHYKTLGHEKDDDLQLLCKGCHEKADKVRIENTCYERGLDTWASKKYGDGWEYRAMDQDAISEEFDDWLERQRSW